MAAKRVLSVFSAVLILCGLAFGVCAEDNPNDLNVFYDTVIIDAGHGGFDGGTSGGRLLEKDLNLNIALKLASLLRFLGLKVILTRDGDRALNTEGTSIHDKKISDMQNRLKIIQEHKNAVFVSIHQNYFSSAAVSGSQVFYGELNDRSINIAQSIQNSIARFLQPKNNRKIKKATKDIYLLYNAKSPAVLIECAFMSNPEELNKMQTKDYTAKLCMCIGTAIRNAT